MIILDTSVLSELTRPTPDPNILNWLSRQRTSELVANSISQAELLYGAGILPPGDRRERLLTEIGGMLREDFARRILPFDSNAARSYAEIAAYRRSIGRPISLADCQIAAIAHSVGAAVATRNVRDFEGCGIEVINPRSDT